MFCRKCGAEVREDALFCHVCGNFLKEKTEEVNVLNEQSYQAVEIKKRNNNILDNLNFVLTIISVILMIVAFVPYIPIVALVLGIIALVIAIILEIKKKYKFSLLSIYLAIGGILGNILLLIYFLQI